MWFHSAIQEGRRAKKTTLTLKQIWAIKESSQKYISYAKYYFIMTHEHARDVNCEHSDLTINVRFPLQVIDKIYRSECTLSAGFPFILRYHVVTTCTYF